MKFIYKQGTYLLRKKHYPKNMYGEDMPLLIKITKKMKKTEGYSFKILLVSYKSPHYKKEGDKDWFCTRCLNDSYKIITKEEAFIELI